MYTKTFALGPSKLNKRYAYAHFAHFAKFASRKELKGKGETLLFPSLF